MNYDVNDVSVAKAARPLPDPSHGGSAAGFLLLSIDPSHPPGLADALARAVRDAGGAVLAAATADAAAWLEPGSPPRSTIVATFATPDDAVAAWPAIATGADGAADLVALAGPCLGADGRQDFPTRANAAPVETAGPSAFMVIQGVVTAAEPMARYRDIIFPMISARGGHYLVYLPRAQLTVLHGRWEQDALIVSQWPDAAAARDFWYCERYQTVAIPTRAGAGIFSVVLLPAA